MLKLKQKLTYFLVTLITPGITFAQFVDKPEVDPPTPIERSALTVSNIFDILIILCALAFIVSLLGFVIGFLRLVTAGGSEVTGEEARKMMVLSGWLFGGAVFGFLLVNIIKYFIY